MRPRGRCPVGPGNNGSPERETHMSSMTTQPSIADAGGAIGVAALLPLTLHGTQGMRG